MNKLFGIALVAVVFGVGCHKEAPPAPSPAVAPPASTPLQITAPASSSPVNAQSPATQSQPSQPANAAEMAASNLVYVNSVFKEWVQKNKRVPKDFEELLAVKAFRVPPNPPAGKRFVIDQQKVEVILMDR